MTYEAFNDFCRSLPATSYVIQWGDSHVWKVGKKVFAIGGRAIVDKSAFTFKTSESDFLFLSDEPGYRPAPYLASRGMMWIQQYNVPDTEEDELRILPQRISPHCFLRSNQEKTKRTWPQSKLAYAS